MIQHSKTRLPISLLIPCILAIGVANFSRIGFSQTVIPSKAPVTAICLTSDGQLVSGSDGGLHLRDAETLQQTKKLPSEIEKFYSIVNSPDQKRIAVSGGSPAELGVVEVFAVPEFRLIQRFERFDDVATDVAWNSNSQLTACSTTGNCCVLKLGEQKPIPFNVHSKSILALAVLKRGEIVSAGKDTSIRVWNPGQAKHARVLNNHVDTVNDIAVRPLGQGQSSGLPMIVSISDDATARFWQPTIGRMVRFARLESIPTAVIWRHDGSQAIVGGRDGSIRLINPNDATQTLALPGTGGWVNDLALAANGQTLFIADQNGIQRVDLKPESR